VRQVGYIPELNEDARAGELLKIMGYFKAQIQQSRLGFKYTLQRFEVLLKPKKAQIQNCP
jgi:hypothetical protein